MYTVTLWYLYDYIPHQVTWGIQVTHLVTLAVLSYQNVSLVNFSSNLSQKGISKLSFLTITTPSFMSIWPRQWWRYSSTEHSNIFNTCITHKACSTLRSLSYRSLLSTSVRSTKICFWKITYSKNFPHFHSVIISFPSGTSNLSKLSGRSTVIDLSFLI